MGRLVGRALVSLVTAVAATLLLAPPASASPIGDAEAAIMAAWEKSGGETSTLGARKGDVYGIADGFALEFAHGKMFYTPDTGAKLLYGPILDKYESLGGPVGSDLGFPTADEMAGHAPGSQVSVFSSAYDPKPVIFWTPEHGAIVVRGAINAAWDRLSSSGGVLGAPVADETYDGDVVAQKFSGGQLSWNRQTKKFTTVPDSLAEQLTGLVIDPAATIDTAWWAAGGVGGQLGAKQGGEYTVGTDGVAQNFAGGKIFYSPATGANALESDILAKYESLGGPGSNLGFPSANEADGGFGSSSRVVTFSATDKPEIFWTPDHGAFVVRGAMKVAWDKLRGPAGKLGAPVADQTTDGDLVSQKFTGGKISWDRAKNSFSTDPANLAPLLAGLQVPGQNQPSTAASPAHTKQFTWQWWYLLVVIPLVALLGLLLLVPVFWLRRRRRGGPVAEDAAYPVGYETGEDGDTEVVGYDEAGDRRWGRDDVDHDADQFAAGDARRPEFLETTSASRVSWPRGVGGTTGLIEAESAGGAYHREFVGDYDDELSEPNEGYDDWELADGDDLEAFDTTPIASEAELRDAARLEAPQARPYVPYVATPEFEVPEVVAPEADVPDIAIDEDAEDAEIVVAEVDDPTFAEPAEARSGRHAALDPDHEDDIEDAEVLEAPEVPEVPEGRLSPFIARRRPAGRPALHLPLQDPYLAPDGYPIKASARFGLYYTPGSPLYHDTIAEIWFATEEVAQANGFIKAD